MRALQIIDGQPQLVHLRLGDAVHGFYRARARNTDRVLVIGAGAIGLAAAAVLQGRGQRFDMAARHPRQQDSAQYFGARLETGDGYDVVLDAVGGEDSLAQAILSVRPQGRRKRQAPRPRPKPSARCWRSSETSCADRNGS